MTATRRISAIQLVVLALLAGCTSGRNDASSVGGNTPQRDAFEVIAYFHGSTEDIADYDVGSLTQIIYSFLHLDGNRLTVGNETQAGDIRSLLALRDSHPDLKVLVAFGGWGGCETCSEVFSQGENRKEFATSVLELLYEYDLDGIDLDWEYPAMQGFPGHAFKPEDQQNFTALVRQLRATLGSDYELSFAASANPLFWEASVEWQEVMPLVDRVNLMTYDLISGEVAEHHTAMKSTAEQGISVDSAVSQLLDLGIDARKIVIGAAFYARAWDEVEAADGDALYRKARFKAFVAYRELDELFASGCVPEWDDRAEAPYCYNPDDGLFASFDDRRSVAAKTRYALDRQLGGIMFWHLAQDTVAGGLLEAIADTIALETRQSVE